MSDLTQIAERLTADGFAVTVEHPGCVVVWAEDLVTYPDRAWWFGTANGTWQGDLCDGGGDYLNETLSTTVPATETDIVKIARAIASVLRGELL